MMDAVPLLAPEQTEELKAMVLGILDDNKKALDDALAEQVQVETTSILSTCAPRQSSTSWSRRSGPRNRRLWTTYATSHVGMR